MRAIIQRVSSATLVCKHSMPVQISRGIVAMIGIEKDDDHATIKRIATRLLTYRLFPDDNNRMNLSLSDIDGDLLLIPNFTIAANTQKGTRASFSNAAVPADAGKLFEQLIHCTQKQHHRVKNGIFGTDMQITLTNDGPVTFILQS